MYLIGDRPVDNDEVFEKINERLKAEINATIDVKFMSWSEYESKYPLIFASGEEWDIIYTLAALSSSLVQAITCQEPTSVRPA